MSSQEDKVGSAPKVLTFGTMLLRNQPSGDPELVNLWYKLRKEYHKEQCLIIDAHSPEVLLSRLRFEYDYSVLPADEVCIEVTIPKVQRLIVMSHPSNVGHYAAKCGGVDGWGRAMVQGLQIALDNGFEYAVHVETDCVLKRSALELVKELSRSGKPFGCPMRKRRNEPEPNVMVFDLRSKRAGEFARWYKWQEASRGEGKILEFWRDDWHQLQLVGGREEDGELDPRGVDFITHTTIAKAMEAAQHITGENQ